jgi:hypothetical protein
MMVVMSVTMRELLEPVAVGPMVPLLVGVAVENDVTVKVCGMLVTGVVVVITDIRVVIRVVVVGQVGSV